MGTRRLRWLLIAGTALATVVAALAVVWILAFRDSATPVSVDEVVARFRAQAQAADLPIPPGVYVYETSGEELISALGGIRHAYPAESTITVAGGGCGVTLRWDVLETRWNEFELCDGARRIGSWRESHQFVGRDDTSSWACSEAAWLPADPEPRAESPYRCETSDTRAEGTTRVVGRKSLQVDGLAIETVHLRTEADESGEARGRAVEDRWLEAGTGLPVRIVYSVRTANASPIGDVIFEESYTLRLVSLEPRR